MKRIAILASGTGSLLEAMIVDGILPSVVIMDRDCRAIEIATRAGIPVIIMTRTFGKLFNRERYTLDMVNVLKRFGIDLVIMAGYMTVFAPSMFLPENFGRKVVNIHPSLLPLFKGDHAVRDALSANATETGTTIHWATERLDDERFIIAQEKVPILPNDTEKVLHERIKQVERVLYPRVVRQLMMKN